MISKVLIFLLLPLFLFSQRVNKIPPPKPKLVVGIVIEQMRYDYLYKYWDKLGSNGFKKLVENGAICSDAHLEYTYTQSAPGYATLATGTNPNMHGIIADKWYNRVKESETKAIEDEKYNCIGNFGKNATHVSPLNLLASSLGDELKLASNYKSKVISVSLEAHASVLSAGHIADGVYWLDNQTGEWIGSKFYQNNLPQWVIDFNLKKNQDIYITREWTTTFPLINYTESSIDKSEYEIGFNGSVTFPYSLSKLADKHNKYQILKSTPEGNTLTKDFAIHAILGEQLGRDEFTDLLYINFTPSQEVGLKFGSISVEIEDLYIKLDNEIAFFLQFLENELGKENILIYLTSNHGIAHSPRYLKDKNIPSGQFKHQQSIELLKSYLSAIYGKGNWIKYYNKGQIYLDHILIEDSKLSLNDVREKTARFMVQFTGISNAVTATTLENSSCNDGIFSQLLQSFNQKRSGDVLLSLEAGWTEQTLSECSDHNSGYAYDTHVPLIWYGWKTERKSIDEKISLTSVAPTISSILQIPNPSMSSINKKINIINNK